MASRLPQAHLAMTRHPALNASPMVSTAMPEQTVNTKGSQAVTAASENAEIRGRMIEHLEEALGHAWWCNSVEQAMSERAPIAR